MAEIITRVGGVDADHVLDLLLDLFGLGCREVDLVEHRHDLVTGVERMIDVGERLCFDALAGVDHQQRSFAGRQRARDFIGEVDMARRVHQVEDVILAVLGVIVQPDGLRLDGDAALALDIHGIEHLFLARHFAIGQPAGQNWIRRSASVDLPWSIWATMEKLRMLEMGTVVMGRGIALAHPRAATILLYFKGLSSRLADSTSSEKRATQATMSTASILPETARGKRVPSLWRLGAWLASRAS